MRQIPCLVGLFPLLMSFSLLGCSSGAPKVVPVTEVEKANFVLHVSNQSLALEKVDLQIRIDGKILVDEEFHVGEGESLAHNWKTFYLDVADGSHKLEVVSKQGGAKLEHSFEKKGKRWAVVDYWFRPARDGRGEPKKITIQIQEKPISFV